MHLAFNTVNAGVNAGGDTPRKVQFSAIFGTLEAPSTAPGGRLSGWKNDMLIANIVVCYCYRCSAKLSTSFVPSHGPITVQSLAPLTMRFRESYSSMSMSCR